MLVDQSLVKDPWADIEDNFSEHIDSFVQEIYSYIDEQKRLEDRLINRASAATNCYKRNWYKGKGIVGIPIAPRKEVNFALGDLAENVVKYWIGKANVGPRKTYSEVDFGDEIDSFVLQGRRITQYSQGDLRTRCGNIDIIGHADGFGKRNSDGRWELIEIKSAANWGFHEFKERGAGDYLRQSHALMRSDLAIGRGITEVRFVYLRKETGHLASRVHQFDNRIWEEVVESYKKSNLPDEPSAPHGPVFEKFRGKPTGRKIMEFPCTYCPYIYKCQGALQKEFKKDQFGNFKPVFVC